MTTTAIDTVLPGIYEGAMHAGLWEAVARGVAPVLKSHGTLAYTQPSTQLRASPASPVVHSHTGFQPAFLDSYVSYYVRKNVWAEDPGRLREGVAVTSSNLFPDDRLKGTEYYADWLKPQDIFYAVGGVVLSSGEASCKLSFVRSEGAGPYSKHEVDFVQRLMPHLKSAAQLSARVGELLEQTQTRTLDALPDALALVGESGELIHANVAARALLKTSRSVQCGGGHLVFVEADLQAKMLSLLRGAAGERPDGFSVSAEQGRLLLSVTPLRGCEHPFGPRVHAIVSLRSAGATADHAVRLSTLREFARHHRLTPVEAEVLGHMLAGATVKEISRSRNCTVNTTRTHVSALLGKTGSRSQRELLVQVLGGDQ